MNNQSDELRVCQILLGKGLGGAERLFVDLTLELQQAGVDVLAICNPNVKISSQLQENGVNCIFIQEASSWDPLASWRINRAVSKHGSHLIHTHLSRASYLTSRAFLRVPKIASIHNYGRWKYYRGSDFYMPITQYGETHIRSHHVPAEKIRIMPNFTRIPAMSQRSYIRKPKYQLLAFGRFVEEKGFQDLITACHYLKESGINFELQLGGDGPYRDILQNLITKFQLEQNINLCGWIEDVVPCLDAADLFILPSRREPFGIVLLEAIARRLPIVTTRSEGPAEFLTEQQAFFSETANPQDLANTIGKALANYEDVGTKTENAFSLYNSQYTPAVVIPQIIDYYKNIARQGRSMSIG